MDLIYKKVNKIYYTLKKKYFLFTFISNNFFCANPAFNTIAQLLVKILYIIIIIHLKIKISIKAYDMA